MIYVCIKHIYIFAYLDFIFTPTLQSNGSSPFLFCPFSRECKLSSGQVRDILWRFSWWWFRNLPVTIPETNIASLKNGCLEYYFPIGEAYFQGLLLLVSGRVWIGFFRVQFRQFDDRKRSAEVTACFFFKGAPENWITPQKINMEPKNHPFEKEYHLLNLHCCVPC